MTRSCAAMCASRVAEVTSSSRAEVFGREAARARARDRVRQAGELDLDLFSLIETWTHR